MGVGRTGGAIAEHTQYVRTPKAALQTPYKPAETLEVPHAMTHKMDCFRHELAKLINVYSLENGSNTPDFLLAEYLATCLDAFDKAVVARESWHGRMDSSPAEQERPDV